MLELKLGQRAVQLAVEFGQQGALPVPSSSDHFEHKVTSSIHLAIARASKELAYSHQAAGPSFSHQAEGPSFSHQAEGPSFSHQAEGP